ncbi:MAG: glycine dehydrogenase [Gammaproteobacteria bacterium]|jgi:glycine dehydrogenase
MEGNDAMSTPRATLRELEDKHEFERRHIGPDTEQVRAMLAALGHDTLEALIDEAVPSNIRTTRALSLPDALTEREALDHLRTLAKRNQVLNSMIGMGYYGTLIPGVIQRNVLENPGWYTAYTPYQAEVSQGRMEVLLSFQQMIIDLSGMALANASLLDEATAAAEAMAMAKRVNRTSQSHVFMVDADCHPQTVAVLRTRAKPLGLEVLVGDVHTAFASPDSAGTVFGVLLSYPGSSGQVRDLSAVITQAHECGALVVVASDLLALAVLKSPGEMGADMVVGSAQRFGVPMGYGGPHAAFFATRDEYKRSMPGRVIGVSVDSHGRQALRMALQTREQHIRREKATSNICTAQVLLAVIAALYACYHGPQGIRRIAQRVNRLTDVLAATLTAHGMCPVNDGWFDTLTVPVAGIAHSVAQRALEHGINVRIVDADHIGVSLDETTTREQVCIVLSAFGVSDDLDVDVAAVQAPAGIAAALCRTSAYLQHPVFNSFHSETEMLRYLRRLQAKDVALDRSMIPLGSCTMKLNATSEMMPVTWPEFGALHPFAPLDQAQGYRELFADLERWLCEITGYDAVSLQPNAGSQGEFAGLLAISRYHEARGEAQRSICLIPSSAHGTNPASAVMAGMQVVVVNCDTHGNVDVSDLRAKAHKHAHELGALMITYPSTHGVFEAAVTQVCEIVHEYGGQVYLDGANLNALVGLARLADIGADVSHLNLHKTFCIPHGGGGPGMGPIGVRQHLAAYLPGHPVVEGVNPHAGVDETMGTISAAPWGSASILPISWAYIAMMGAHGLTRATSVAILAANYVAARLRDYFPIVYTGNGGRVAHECIIDLRAIKEACGVSVDDVAKRLVDFGIHAPTMSWPVHDTMMIEPTESESLREIDRFCDAMITIRNEISAIERGEVDVAESALRHAPHTHQLLLDEWSRVYSREQAFFPAGVAAHEDKYWPPVGRVDNVYGDRNLVCSCPPMSAYIA